MYRVLCGTACAALVLALATSPAVAALAEQGAIADAIAKLDQDLLQKTNGCALAGAPDKNDWVTSCVAQAQLSAALDALRDALQRR